MNFTDIYKKIRSIDEGSTPEPTAPGGVIKTKNADGTISYKPKVPGERLTGTFSATGSGAKVSTDAEKDKQPANETCGDMMALPTSMGHDHPAQSDSVTMNVSMNGSGDGGIRDLMNILKGIENVGEPHGDHDAVDVVFGGEMEPEMEAFANSMAGASGQQTFPPAAVTDLGSNSGRGDHEAPKANGGGNPYTQVSEELVNRLSNLYQEIKDQGVAEADELRARGGLAAVNKKPRPGQTDLRNIPAGNYPGSQNKFTDKDREEHPANLKAKIKATLGKHTRPNLPDQGVSEGYNPNSASAEHRRSLEKSHEDSLKKKAADGDESAKKQLQALKDKKERMRNDYNDRMER